MKSLISGLIILLGLCWIALPTIVKCAEEKDIYRVYIDPGHNGSEKDISEKDISEKDISEKERRKQERYKLEVETNLAVGLKLKELLSSDTRANIHWEVKMSREDGGGIKGLKARATDANNFEADLFLSIHCNAGGGTGTETFWCDLDENDDLHPNRKNDQRFARLVQKHMVHMGDWSCPNKSWDVCRRVVEDCTYVKKNGKHVHLPILQFSDAPGCLNEIGFADTPTDAAKLRSDQWRDQFALAYRDAIFEFFRRPLTPADANGDGIGKQISRPPARDHDH